MDRGEGGVGRARPSEAKTLPRRIGHGFNLVAVGVANKGAVVVGVVLRTQTRFAFVRPAVLDRGPVKAPHGFPVRRLKGDMHAVAGTCRTAVRRRFEAEDDV